MHPRLLQDMQILVEVFTSRGFGGHSVIKCSESETFSSSMKLCVIISLLALFTHTQQAPPNRGSCTCELTDSEKAFPHDKLQTAEGQASTCNSNITPQKTLELESLLLGLERRLSQLHKDMLILENEDDGDLYGVLSLHVIENELAEINQLINKLNITTLAHQQLTANATQQLKGLKDEMQELLKFDTMEVIRGRQENKLLSLGLLKCKKQLNTTVAPTQPPQGTCPRSQLASVTGPRVYTQGEYPGSYPYGAWGRDPKPEMGKESWYWVVMLTSGNIYSNYIRLYSSLSALIVGVSKPGNILIHSSNPTTNTIQGPNNVIYGGSLYYNCYNQDRVCRFNLTSKTVATLQLPKGTRFAPYIIQRGTSVTWMNATHTLTWTWQQMSQVSGSSTPPPRTLVTSFCPR
ncbi:olfactomedin-4-like isoform 2-T2 [Pholidichthys leucotaenia]